MSAYLYYAKMKILVSLTYRFEVISSLFTNFIIMFSTVYFWKVAYKGIGSASGVNEKQMITYAILSILLGTIFGFSVENVVNDRVREGDVAIDFMKPVSVFGIYFAQDFGNLVCSLVQKLLPLLIASSALFFIPAPSSASHFILFILSFVQSYFILWFISAIVGLSSFWIIDLGPVGYVKDILIRVLSGSIVPIWFFPQIFQNVLKYFPFIYIYQLPLGIYIGKIGFDDAVRSMFIQTFWLALILLVFYIMQKKSRNNLHIQGG
jgi:ABC-2 type transport system permease protein